MNKELDHERSEVVLSFCEAKTMGGLKTLLRNANEIGATNNVRRLERRIRLLNNQRDRHQAKKAY